MSKDDIDFLEKGVKFKRKPAKMGRNRYVFTIPQTYIDNGLIDPNETYIIYLAKTEEEEDD